MLPSRGERRPSLWRGDDRGLVSTMFAVLAVFFFLIIGVVAEGGRKLENVGRAQDLAAEAARAASATLDAETVASGDPLIDADADADGGLGSRARMQAEAVLAASGRGAVIEEFVVAADRRSVFVVVRVSGTSALPGFSIDGIGSHGASVVNPFGGP